MLLVLSKIRESGHLKRVIQESLKALDIYPNDIPLRRLLADAYLESGQIAQAESELNRIITQIDDLISLYKTQVDILIQQKRENEAIDLLKIYLAHKPDDKDSSDQLNTLLARKDAALAPEPEPAEEKLPEIATATLAEVYFQQNQLQDAIETYEKVIVLRPEDESSRRRLEELRGMMTKEQQIETPERDPNKKTKELISILERWLSNIREQSITGLSTI